MTDYAIGDTVEITYSPTMAASEEITVTGTIFELDRSLRFR
jgi:hypothetical protein